MDRAKGRTLTGRLQTAIRVKTLAVPQATEAGVSKQFLHLSEITVEVER